MPAVMKGKNAEGDALDDKIKARAAEIEKEQGEDDDTDDREDREAKPPREEPDDDRDDREEREEPRQRKKDDRWQRMNAERDRAQAEAAELRGQLSQTLALLQERQRAPEPKKDEADPFAEKLSQIKRERGLLMREIQAGAGKFTQEQLDAIEKRAEALEEEHVEVLAERLVSKRGLAQPRQQEHPLKPFLALQFPDVVSNKNAVDYARAYFQQQVALGRPSEGVLGQQLVVESHQRAREALRTQPNAPKVDPKSAPRRVGMSAGPGAGSVDEPSTPQLTKEQKKMADALYGDSIPEPAKRYAKWAKGPGARLAAKS